MRRSTVRSGRAGTVWSGPRPGERRVEGIRGVLHASIGFCAMGVLDDAIREHLELKRRHGAAEEDLRRQEAEALGPARREVAPAEDDETGEQVPAEAADAADAADAPAEAQPEL